MTARIVIAVIAISITGASFYISRFRRSLANAIKHKHVSAEERSTAHARRQIESLPVELIDNPEKFRIIHESDAKSCAVTPPATQTSAEQMFTLLLRRNMSCFSRMPQCWVLRLIAKTPEQTQSFSISHIQALDFKAGDLFCGFNRVLERSPTKIEIELVAPKNMGDFSGRLICSLNPHETGSVLETQTLQWTKADSSTMMPLERPPAKFLHQMASWWLLVTGAKYLEKMALDS